MPESTKTTVLNIGQTRRVEALRVSSEVLSNTRNIFGGRTPVPATGVDDLLKVAEWVIGEERPTLADLLGAPGVGVMELKGEQVGGFLDFLSSVGCSDPECEIHGAKAATTEGTSDEDRRPDDTEAGDPGYKYPEEAEVDPASPEFRPSPEQRAAGVEQTFSKSDTPSFD